VQYSYIFLVFRTTGSPVPLHSQRISVKLHCNGVHEKTRWNSSAADFRSTPTLDLKQQSSRRPSSNWGPLPDGDRRPCTRMLPSPTET
jgi:hypothetical protein